jgi:hypothetical protein
VAKALGLPLTKNVKELMDLPYTLSFVIRKRIQIDGMNELPKDKRPPDKLIWDGSTEEMDRWFEDVFGEASSKSNTIMIDPDTVEG